MSLLAGRYETIRAIAAGGMATVHLAKAVGLGGFERLVAVKVMHPHLSLDPDFVAMFLDEARLAAGIRHPNVVATIDVQQADEGLFLVMEYIEGCSLRVLLRALARKKQRLPVPIALRIMTEALAGLHAAHELRDSAGKALHLVHRDVSPANILVGADGVTRLTDFGVARAESRISSTRGGQLKGKIPYMPPEQIMGEEVDRRVDVYATGLVLWEALVGRRAFRAPNEGALLHTILTGAVDPPSKTRRDVPAHVDRVCMKGLALKPEERYPTAAAFADALEQAAADANVRVATARAVAELVQEVTADVGTAPVGEGASDPVPDWSVVEDIGDDEPGPGEGANAGSDEATAATVSSVSAVAASVAAQSASTSPALASSTAEAEPADDLPSQSQSTSVAAALSAEALGDPPPRASRRRVIVVGATLAVAVGIAAGVGLRMSESGDEPSGPAGAPTETSVALSSATAGPDEAPATEAPTATTATASASVATATASASPSTPAPQPRPRPTTKPAPKPTAQGPGHSPTAPTSPTGYRPTQL